LGDVAPGRFARVGVPVGNDRAGVHGGVVQEVGGGKLAAGLIPGGRFQGLPEQLAELLFQGAIVANAFFAFPGLFRAEGFGGAFSLKETGPAIIGAVELGRFGFAGAVGFAASAAGGGDAAGEQREGDLEGHFF